MYKNKKIGIVIRAYNEGASISSVVGMVPDFVDRIYLVNDGSTDGTPRIVSQLAQNQTKLVAINHAVRMGAGSATISGFKKAIEENIDIVASIDGDGQMASSILYQFLDPLVSGQADFVKGDRLSRREYRKEMPVWRTFGNLVLTYLTRAASGYWHLSDPQNGYTAISKETLAKLDLDKIHRGFAFENDILVKLNVVGAKVLSVPHAAVYGGQQSKINYISFIFQTSWLLLRDFFWRVNIKYRTGKNARPKRSVQRTS